MTVPRPIEHRRLEALCAISLTRDGVDEFLLRRLRVDHDRVTGLSKHFDVVLDGLHLAGHHVLVHLRPFAKTEEEEDGAPVTDALGERRVHLTELGIVRARTGRPRFCARTIFPAL